MAELCRCDNQTLGNSGVPGCDSVNKVLAAQIRMFTVDSDGAKNFIDPSVTIDDAFITAKLNHVDPTKRWYPTGLLENIGGERAETKFAEANSGNRFRLKAGAKNLTAEIWNQGPALLEELEKAQCSQMSFFNVDTVGNIQGLKDSNGDGLLYPIRAQKGSVDNNLMEASEDDISRIAISMNYDPRERDANLRTISAADISADLLDMNGLFGISSVNDHTIATEITITLREKYGSFGNTKLNGGLLITDFFDEVGGTGSNLYNVTTDTAIPITGFAESSTGVYVLTISAQTTSDIIRITPVKDGFEYSAVVSNTVTSL